MSIPAPSTPAGNNFQHYEILRRDDGSPWELGRGTMGITYKAFDVNLCCEVALKVVNAALLDHVRARDRFVREARAAAALRHRNVASVYHLGNDGERFFYAMEFIDGETLDALVRRDGPLPVDLTLRLLLQTARALAAAGRQNLVHRDIKPANLMVTREDADEFLVVKVIDFGLARPVAGTKSGGSSGQLTAGGFVGTPQFASPEQWEEKSLDARSDIYSLGVTAWFLLTGRAPFAGSLATICQKHLHEKPPWAQLSDWMPEPVRALLAHMLEKDPARRPQDAVALRREIEDCIMELKARPAEGQMALPPVGEEAGSGEGSIVDRLTLVSGESAPVGRWLFGIAAVVMVFVAVVTGVWIALAQRLPVRPPTVAVATPTASPSRVPPHRPAMPRPTVPPPLPKEKTRPTPAAEIHLAPSTPAATVEPPTPTPRPEPEVRRALPPLTPFDPDGTPEPHNSPGGA